MPIAVKPSRRVKVGSALDLNRSLLIGVLLIVSVFAVYEPVLRHDFVYFDDNLYITQNKIVRSGLSWHNLIWALQASDCSWHPLTWASHMLDVELFGLNPGYHHLTSVLFHILNSLLVFVVLRNMTGALWRSALVAALFALHPLNVESVAWLSQRKSLLCFFCWILCMGSYARYIRRPERLNYALVFFWVMMGALCKPMIVTLPFVLLLLDYWPLGRLALPNPVRTRDLILEKIPFFILAAASAGWTYWVQKGAGAVRSMGDSPMFLRIANAGVGYVTYIYKMVWPFDLAFLYPFPSHIPIWQAGGAAVFLAALTGLAILLRRRYPWFAVGWFWYLGTLVPVIGFVRVGAHAIADRYVYIPFIGLWIIISWGLARVAESRRIRLLMGISHAVIFVLLMLIARQQVRVWADSQTLFEHALAITEKNSIAHNNLGVVLAEQGQEREAVKHFRQALDIDPGYVEARDNLQVLTAVRAGIQKEVAQLQTLVALHPVAAPLHFALAERYHRLGDMGIARQTYEKTLSLAPDDAPAYIGLGLLLAAQGKYAQAVTRLKRAASLAPEAADAFYYMAGIYAWTEREDEALTYLQTAVQRGFDDWDRLRKDRHFKKLYRNAEFVRTYLRSK
jgi:protein O-mannosyl-transferase